MTQFNEGKEYKGIRTLKIFEFEKTRSHVKKYYDHWKKRKQYVRQITYINQGHSPTKVTPVIDFTNKPII